MTGTVLLLCAPDDAGAADLARRLAPHSLTAVPADLSSPGWSYSPLPGRRRGVAEGHGFQVTDLRAVHTRLFAVEPAHLPHVRVSDRDYVAAEETAFLRAWLSDLPVRVINPPQVSSLSGPLWHPAMWARVAIDLGIDVLPTLARAGVPTSTEADGGAVVGPTDSDRRVSICGGSAIRDADLDERHLAITRALAAAVGADYLTAHFSGERLGYVETWPAPCEPDVLDLLATELGGEPGEGAP